jgi:hypothetical protein
MTAQREIKQIKIFRLSRDSPSHSWLRRAARFGRNPEEINFNQQMNKTRAPTRSVMEHYGTFYEFD